jgi:hypothetical protein
MKNDDELAALKRELKAELKAELEAEAEAKPSARDAEREAAEWRDKMHRGAEARMSSVAVAPEVLRDYARACPTSDVQDLVRHGRVQSPSQAGTSGQVTVVRGAGTGWQRGIPLSNPPGTGPGSPADRIAEEFDRRERAELAQRLGALKR